MKPSEVLKKALELLGPNGEHWTKGQNARDVDGNRPSDKPAVCWCIDGALRTVILGPKMISTDPVDKQIYKQAGSNLSLVLPNRKACPFYEDELQFVPWQDTEARTFAEVKAKFLEAINLAESKEA